MLKPAFRPPMTGRPSIQRGFSLIELLITVAIAGLLLALGMPAYQDWVARSKVRTAAESLLSGLVTARNEALQKNSLVNFYLTSSLDDSCTLSDSGNNWVISLDDPSDKCATQPSDTAEPRIVQKRAGAEGGVSATISATNAASAAANRLIFTGLGRIQATTPPAIDMNPISTIDISYPQRGTCQSAGGPVRCLRIQISTGGEGRLCDPAVDTASDPRRCGP